MTGVSRADAALLYRFFRSEDVLEVAPRSESDGEHPGAPSEVRDGDSVKLGAGSADPGAGGGE